MRELYLADHMRHSVVLFVSNTPIRTPLAWPGDLAQNEGNDKSQPCKCAQPLVQVNCHGSRRC